MNSRYINNYALWAMEASQGMKKKEPVAGVYE